MTVFDDTISSDITDLLMQGRCMWCRIPHRPIVAKGLCVSCYKWDKEQRKLAKQIAGLPPRGVKDAYSTLRHNLDVANRAIELCKIEGEVLEARLKRTDRIDLEEEFDALAKKMLGRKRAEGLFTDHAFYFYGFSPTQRAWIWYLISLTTNEWHRRERRERARRIRIDSENRAAEATSAITDE